MARPSTPRDARISARTASVDTGPRGWGTVVVGGLVAGAIAGMAMAMWTMVAGATFRSTGFFTPMYLIASPFSGTEAAAGSLQAARAGELFFWSTGPGLLGAAIHMANSMMFGVLFGVGARLLRLRRLAGLVTGMAFGVAVMFVMDWLVQPTVAFLFGGGRFVTDVGGILGWGTWTVAHLLFGGMLGLWVALRPDDVAGNDQGVTLR